MKTNVRQVVDGRLLSEVITLPDTYKNTLVEIIVTPVKAKTAKKGMTRDKLRAKLKGSHTESLSGVLPRKQDISLEKLREERRRKYESPA